MRKINFAEPNITKIEKVFLNKAINSKWISKGSYVNLFEKKISRLMGSKYSITANNGTSAFLLILLSLGIKKGDEVIVPSLCYVSPIHMIKMVGATPVVVDVEIDTFQMNPDYIQKKITKKTKAILAIHNFGGLSNIKKIENISIKNNINLIEDISETLLSKLDGRYIGSSKSKKLKKIAFSSLHATKTLTTGEGGFVITDQKKIYFNLKKIRDHGIKDSSKYFYDRIGGNFRLSNLLAAIGCAQLSKINEIKNKKKFLDKFYIKNFENNSKIAVQSNKFNSELIKWGFPVKFENKIVRDKILQKLNKYSILARPCFLSLNSMKHLGFKRIKKNNFKNSTILQDRILILPLHTKLNVNDMNYICKIVNSV